MSHPGHQPVEHGPAETGEPSSLASLRPQFLRHSRPQDWLLWLAGRRRRFRVVGDSMRPLLLPDTEVMICPNRYRRQLPAAGQIVLAEHPQQPGFHLLKWVVFVEEDGRCYLQGLNQAHSTDSRQFGLVAREHLLGQVVCRFP